jgi:hypothetical protein
VNDGMETCLRYIPVATPLGPPYRPVCSTLASLRGRLQMVLALGTLFMQTYVTTSLDTRLRQKNLCHCSAMEDRAQIFYS